MQTEKEIRKLFSSFNRIKVAIMGDLMLDNYVFGSVDRISPEAPVPVVSVNATESRCGGAANVAANIRSLGASPYLFSVIGDDHDGDILMQQLKKSGIDTKYLLRTSDRITTTKTRILSKNHQILRIDKEDTRDLSSATENKLIRSFTAFIAQTKPDILIFEDYNKGVLTENCIQSVTQICKKNKIAIAVDPKHKNFFAYTDCTLFKPNLREINDSLRVKIDAKDRASLHKSTDLLQKKLHQQITMITLGENGMYVREGKKTFMHEAHIRNISDVSGAGDTVISVAAVCLAAGAETGLLTSISNIAGGLVCESAGVVPVNKDQLLREALHLLCG